MDGCPVNPSPEIKNCFGSGVMYGNQTLKFGQLRGSEIHGIGTYRSKAWIVEGQLKGVKVYGWGRIINN